MRPTPFDVEGWTGGFSPDRLVVWAGAGVSSDAPTLLPLGHGLTDFALDEACGRQFRDRLVDLWQRANEVCAEPARPQPFAARPRLESVLGGFAELEQDAEDPSLAFLPTLEAFAPAPPNPLHFSLASLVLQGSAVFTTNFDLCIQDAVRRLTGREEPFDVAGSGSIRRFLLKPGLGAGEIVHVHGVADDPAFLGATLARVKTGLPRPFESLEARLQKGAVLVMAGYSASDSFDVTPYFARQPSGRWPGSALVFVRHEGSASPPGLGELASGFRGLAEISTHTGAFLASLAGGVRNESPDPPFDWRPLCRAKYEPALAETQRPLRTCSVAHALGINVDVLDPDAYERAEACNPGFAPDRYEHLLAMTGRERGSPEKELEHTTRTDESRRTLGYEYAAGRFGAAADRALSVDEIRRRAAEDEVLAWEPYTYTSMSTHGRILLMPYLARPWRRPGTAEQIGAAAELKAAVRVLADRPFHGVLFIRQLATAHRMDLLLRALFGEAPDPLLERSTLDLYAETADVAGFVSSYRDLAMERLLRVRYAPWRTRRTLLREAGGFAARSARLATLLSDRSGRRRALQLRLLVLGYRAFWLAAPRLALPSPIR